MAEKRAALIHQAVTKGLDATVPMKDSGVPWIGEIPAHWEVKRLKYATGEGSELGLQMGPFGASLTGVSREPSDFCVFGQANTISGDFGRVNRWVSRLQYEQLAQYTLGPGDIVLTRKGSLGNCRLVPQGIPVGIIDSDTIRLRVSPSEMAPAFVVLLLHEAHYVHTQIDRVRRGAILPGLNTSVVGNLQLVCPAPQTQVEILRSLSEGCGKLFDVETKCHSQLVLLREYRQALITAAVTGQLEIPEAVA